MKHIVIIGDGMADHPVARLGGRTPLMAANKPAIDDLARRGRCGQFVTVEADMPPGSEVANLTVLGYDPKQCYQGRGVLEAASLGVAIRENDVAMRCNVICVVDGRIKNHSAGHIPTEEARELVKDLQAKLGSDIVRFHPGISYRHLLVLSQGSPELEMFPPHDHVGKPIAELMVRAKNAVAEPTAKLLNDLILRSHEILADHPVNNKRAAEGKDPANYIWPWSPGRKPAMRTLRELYGIKGAVISAVDLINGTGVLAGLDVIPVRGATGLHDTNYEGKADAAVAALRDHDFVYCHVEATDEAGHAKDLDLKIKCIEYLDQRLVARIMGRLEEQRIEAVVAVLPDHATPVESGNHVKDPVPVAIYDPRAEPDGVERYDEDAVTVGALGMMHGNEFIRQVLNR
ncbi:cofactor-independent phosphoglycerate mutase [bacterium]|nr:cofactor-independent phosphoglycerate mutase [bacterium]